MDRETRATAQLCGFAVAARAAAVCFESAVEAHIALALRLLEGPPPGEWFWPLAVPAWTPEASRGEALRALALALADRPEAATAVRAWVGALARGGHGGALLAALTPEDRRHLIERVGGRPPIAPETGSQPRAFLAALGVGGGPAAAPGGEPSPRERPPGEAPQGASSTPSPRRRSTGPPMAPRVARPWWACR